ncbi:MAG: hypothetical protein LDL53_00460 [Candidatus Hydrogenedens sp.]|nr:hypothetical protein [Candidatus Hydrogenedens sp.]
MKKNSQHLLTKSKNTDCLEKEFLNHTVLVSQDFLEQVPSHCSLWYESPEEIEKKLAWGEEKTRLLQWVRKQVQRKLSPKEKRYIEMYYFQGLTLETISERSGANPSAIHRALRRGIRKLIHLTKDENLCFQKIRIGRTKKNEKE